MNDDAATHDGDRLEDDRRPPAPAPEGLGGAFAAGAEPPTLDDDAFEVPGTTDAQESQRVTAERAGLWTGNAAAYDRGLANVYAGSIDLVLDTLAARVPLSGARLVDVGCGGGRLLAAAAARGAVVTGVDPAPDMRALAAAAVPGATLLEGVSPTLPLPDDSCDIAVGHFLLEHVGDPRGALADLARITRPGGVVGVTIWAPDSALSRLWSHVTRHAGAEPVPGRRVPEQYDFARSGTGLAGMLDGAGLRDIEVHTVAWLANVAPDDLWASPASGIGALGHLLQGQDEATLARARRAFDERLAEREDLVCEAIFAVGVPG